MLCVGKSATILNNFIIESTVDVTFVSGPYQKPNTTDFLNFSDCERVAFLV